MTKIWSNSEASYKAQISDYNTYLNKFGTAVVFFIPEKGE